MNFLEVEGWHILDLPAEMVGAEVDGLQRGILMPRLGVMAAGRQRQLQRL